MKKNSCGNDWGTQFESNSLMDIPVAKIEKRDGVVNREWPQLHSPQHHTSKHVMLH